MLVPSTYKQKRKTKEERGREEGKKGGRERERNLEENRELLDLGLGICLKPQMCDHNLIT